MNSPSTSILLLGCGNMGSALLSRWKNLPEFSNIRIVDPNAKETIPHVKNISELGDFKPSIIVIAVKPQQLDEVMPTLAKQFGTAPIYLSIAAGKPLSYYEEKLGKGAQIVRAMPNTPAMVGEGITALVANAALDSKGRTVATKLMEAVGEVIWLESEGLMDAATAISGSGPAYYYYIVECMAAVGVKLGLSEKDAKKLAVKTFTGSAELASSQGGEVEKLRTQVTSPGGTTAAAIAELQKDDSLHRLIKKAADAAIVRAKTL